MEKGEREVRVWRNPISGEIEILLSTPMQLCQPGEWGGKWIGAIGTIKNKEIKWGCDVERRLELTGITKDKILEDLRVWAASQRRQIPIPPDQNPLPTSLT